MPPPQTDVLANGDFQDPPPGWISQPWVIVSGAPGTFDGWTGSDIEWGQESLYLPGGNTTNRVIEMDGNGGSAITTIEQSFAVDGRVVTGTLSFDMALRSGQPLSAGEGFTVEILDGFGNLVVPKQTYLPTSSAWQTVTLSVPFDEAGTYTIRFTEVGTNNSLGAVLDDVSFLVCFTAGTLIDTPSGARRVDELRPGDLVSTVDRGPQRVRWVGRRTVTRQEMLHDPRLGPVTIAAGAFGPKQPARELAVSRQHRILRAGWDCELHFAEPEVLIAAHRLVNGQTIRLAEPSGDVTYVHFLCERHEIVLAEGLPAESFYPCQHSLNGVEAEAQAELLLIFPELRDFSAPPLDLVRPVIEGKLARLVA